MSSVTRRRTSGLAIVLGGILALLGGQVREATGVPTLPFTDNFSASDGSELSADWTDRSGNITVVNNQATGSGPGKTNVSTVNGISAANVKIISTVALAAGQDVGLVTRYSGPQESSPIRPPLGIVLSTIVLGGPPPSGYAEMVIFVRASFNNTA